MSVVLPDEKKFTLNELWETFTKRVSNEDEKRIIEKCSQILESSSMSFNLKRLCCENFRGFEEIKIDFDEKLTVLLGENSTGKTSILEAIAKHLSVVSSNIAKDSVNGLPLRDIDIRLQNSSSANYCGVSCAFRCLHSELQSRLIKLPAGSELSFKSEIRELKEFASILRVVNAYRAINLPIFAYYSSKRSVWNLSSQKVDIRSVSLPPKLLRMKLFGNDALRGDVGLQNFENWFILINKADFSRKALFSFSADLFKLPVDILEGDLALEQSPALKDLIKTVQETHEKKLLPRYEKENKFLSQAIKLAVPDIEQIKTYFLNGLDEIYVDLSNGTKDLDFSCLSDGQRVFVGLVADIAYRLILANPNLDNPLLGKGIVLIDEIELHLHPRWQQIVLPNLLKTFPNVQFVVTTHSPQVLTTIHKQHLRQLMSSENSDQSLDVRRVNLQTRGISSTEVLESVMGVSSTPLNIEESSLVQKYESNLRQEKEKEANEALNMIKSHFGENSSAYKTTLSLKKISEIKKRMRINKNVEME